MYIRIFFSLIRHWMSIRMQVNIESREWNVNIVLFCESVQCWCWCRTCNSFKYMCMHVEKDFVLVAAVKRNNFIQWDNLCRLSENDRSHWPSCTPPHMPFRFAFSTSTQTLYIVYSSCYFTLSKHLWFYQVIEFPSKNLYYWADYFFCSLFSCSFFLLWPKTSTDCVILCEQLALEE